MVFQNSILSSYSMLLSILKLVSNTMYLVDVMKKRHHLLND